MCGQFFPFPIAVAQHERRARVNHLFRLTLHCCTFPRPRPLPAIISDLSSPTPTLTHRFPLSTRRPHIAIDDLFSSSRAGLLLHDRKVVSRFFFSFLRRRDRLQSSRWRKTKQSKRACHSFVASLVCPHFQCTHRLLQPSCHRTALAHFPTSTATINYTPYPLLKDGSAYRSLS
jgi:hypothetical protein